MGKTKAKPTVSGIASARGAIVDSFMYGSTQILPGAFRKTIEEWRLSGEVLPFVWTHDYYSSLPIGGVSSLREDPSAGLLFTAWIDEADEFAMKIFNKIASGLITGVSIGFTATKETRGKLSNGTEGRLITEVDLGEISACLFPADKGAHITSVSGVSSQKDWQIDDSQTDAEIAAMAARVQTDSEIQEMLENYEDNRFLAYARRKGYRC